jgi:hypothetical protein
LVASVSNAEQNVRVTWLPRLTPASEILAAQIGSRFLDKLRTSEQVTLKLGNCLLGGSVRP